jgi:hypothetical protein
MVGIPPEGKSLPDGIEVFFFQGCRKDLFF